VIGLSRVSSAVISHAHQSVVHGNC